MTPVSQSLPRPPQGLIDTPAALAEVCSHLKAARVFGFDTEFIGEATYRPVLCLLQVATDERVELIDPLAFEDLGPFWELLADPEVEKICHAGDQDLAIAWQLGRRAPRNLFDCQIGAGFVGIKHPLAYGRLVEVVSGAKLKKGDTRSAWDRRPLSHSQFEYAVHDVLYLPQIHRFLRSRLEALGHEAWMREACEELCARAAADPDPRLAFMKVKGASRLTPRHLAVLRELAALREQLASERNLPLRRMLKDEVLLDLALRAPQTEADLIAIPGLPRGRIATYGEQLISAIARGRAVPPEQQPRLSASGEDSAETGRLTEIMYASSQVICLGQSVWPSLVTSRSQIEGLARLVSQGEDVSDHALMNGWTGECLGAPLLELVRGNTELTLHVRPERMHAEFEPRE